VIQVDLRLLEGGILLVDLRTRGDQHGLHHAELGGRRLDRGGERLIVRLGRLDLGDGESWAACDVSRSLRAMSLRANSSVLRSKSRLESTTATCAFAVWAFDSASAALAFSMSARARSTCASWLRTVALADSTSAFAWFTFARKMSGRSAR